MIRLLEDTSTKISKDIDDMIEVTGSTIVDTYNSIQTTKGTDSSRQATFHRDIKFPNGRVVSMKFDPIPLSARSSKGYRYVEFDPNNEEHKNLKKYVRVPYVRYRGDYKDEYNLYIKSNNEYKHIDGLIHTDIDLDNAFRKIDDTYDIKSESKDIPDISYADIMHNRVHIIINGKDYFYNSIDKKYNNEDLVTKINDLKPKLKGRLLQWIKNHAELVKPDYNDYDALRKDELND